MRIIDGIRILKASPAEIPDCSRREIPRFFREMGYRKGVEIGVQRGKFTRRLLRAGLQVYAVDPWLSYREYHAFKGYQRHQNEVYAFAVNFLKRYPYCHIIRKKSMDAVKDFRDNSLDFVYIDGHHGFKYVVEDIYEWSKKIRRGGIISGHDYAYGRWKVYGPYVLQVKEAVDAYTKAFRIKNWWVLGRKKKKFPNEKRDQYRSWMWIKG